MMLLALSKESQCIESSSPLEKLSGHIHDLWYADAIEQEASLPLKIKELNDLELARSSRSFSRNNQCLDSPGST
jgi:hypothetical protein